MIGGLFLLIYNDIYIYIDIIYSINMHQSTCFCLMCLVEFDYDDSARFYVFSGNFQDLLWLTIGYFQGDEHKLRPGLEKGTQKVICGGWIHFFLTQFSRVEC